MTKKEAERIAALEAKFEGMSEDVTEIKGDVKLLVAAHHKQKGEATVWAMVCAGIGSALTLIAGWLLSKFG